MRLQLKESLSSEIWIEFNKKTDPVNDGRVQRLNFEIVNLTKD